MVLPLAIGLGLAGGGAVANYFGSRSEARRKQDAIDEYDNQTKQINARLLAILADQGQREQEGLTQGIAEGGAPATAAAGQSEADRSALVNAHLAALAADQPAAAGKDAPTAQAAAYNRAMGKSAVRLKASDALRLVGEQNRRRGVAMQDGGTRAMVNAPRVATGQTRAQLDRQKAEADLQSVLGTTGNGAANLQLLGALANMGSSAAFTYGARA